MFFSAKAGCTFATKWFFDQLGILEEAQAYHDWIHRYRFDVYYRKKAYLSALKSIFSEGYLRVKLVRSPYQRAVSSYLHAVKSTYLTADMSAFLGRNIDVANSYSFEEFVRYIDTTGVTRCNPHHRQQVERREIDGTLTLHRLICLESSFDGFRKLEDEFALKKADLESMSQSEHHRLREKPTDTYCGDRPYTQKDKSFGAYQCFYNDTLRDSIARIYSRDFLHYGYQPHEL